jgi:surface polysaccharide O-acyltransferase-like enzyme
MTSPLTGSAPARQHDVDWLRVLAVLSLFVLHAAYPFDPFPWHIKSPQQSHAFWFLIAFLNEWNMPLFFLLSGVGTWFALGFRSGGQYVRERFRRLALPLLFGLLLIAPPQAYYEQMQRGQFAGSLPAFYPHYFQTAYLQGNVGLYNLWFLLYLFAFSLIALPLLIGLRRAAGRRLIDRLAALAEKRGVFLLFGLPLALSEMLLRGSWPDHRGALLADWANVVFWLGFFLFGYLFAADARFGQAAERHRRAALGLGSATMLLLYALWLTAAASGGASGPAYVVEQAVHGFNVWFWVVGFLGLGRRYLNFTNGLLKYASEAALPVYILHQMAIIAVGFYVVAWDVPLAIRYLVLLSAGFVLTLGLYEAIRRFNVTRFLFGLKPLKQTPGS